MCGMMRRFLKLEKQVQKALVDLNRIDIHVFPKSEVIQLAQEIVNALDVVECSMKVLSKQTCTLTMADCIFTFLKSDLRK